MMQDDDDDDDNNDPMILNNRAKNHTSERTIVPWTVIFCLLPASGSYQVFDLNDSHSKEHGREQHYSRKHCRDHSENMWERT